MLLRYLITLALFMHGIGHVLFLMNSWGLSRTDAGRSWLFSGVLGAGQTVEGIFGLLWLTLTLAFEIGLGRATGMSWDRLASDFDPRRGGLLGFGMLVVLLAPRMMAPRRGLVDDAHHVV